LSKSGTNGFRRGILLCGVCLLTCGATDIFKTKALRRKTVCYIAVGLTPSGRGMLDSSNSANVHCHNHRTCE